MSETEETSLVQERVEHHILNIRGQNVMLDSDLAKLYGVTTGMLNQAVKRNSERFPEDFMFVLLPNEAQSLLSQSVIAKVRRGGRRNPTYYAFTEQGVAMLSSVLRSKRAVQVNIEIMRTFVGLRKMLLSHQELAWKLVELEQNYDAQFQAVFEAIRLLIETPPTPERRMGFRVEK